MTDSLPEPLTPPESDLQDFAFMPLHVARLRDSDLAAEEHPEACWYAVLLWSASWHQLPAGSLPDNETVLARLCGLGRDLKTFRKHRAGAMRGFVQCSDGRLYHPVVAEEVHKAWGQKLQQRWRTECARIKKHNQRTGEQLPQPTFEEFVAGDKSVLSPEKGQDVPRDNRHCPEGKDIQGTETGTGNNKNPPNPLGGEQADLLGEKPEHSKRKPKRPIPDGLPSEEDIALAQVKAREARADVDMAYQAVRFRNWAIGSDHRYADWGRTWDNWVLRTIREAPKRAGAPMVAEKADPMDVWRRRVDAYLNGSKYWNTNDWEAPPGKPGCIVPAQILAEFGIAPQEAGASILPFPGEGRAVA